MSANYLLTFFVVLVSVILSMDSALAIAWVSKDIQGKDRHIILAGALVVLLGLQTAMVIVVGILMDGAIASYIAALILIAISCEWVLFQRGSDRTKVQAVAGNHVKWQAMKTIAAAGAVMSIDNVFAMVSMSDDTLLPIAIGVAASSIISVYGCDWVLKSLKKFPSIIYAMSGTLVLTAIGLIFAVAPLKQVVEGYPQIGEYIGIAVAALFSMATYIYNISRGRSAKVIVEEAENGLQRLENQFD